MYEGDATGTQTFEDYEDSNVIPGRILGCVSPADSDGDNGVCFDAGDLEEGAIWSESPPGTHAPPQTPLALVGAGYNKGVQSSALCNYFACEGLRISFTGGTTYAFGAQVAALYAPSGIEMTIFRGTRASGGGVYVEEIGGDFSQFLGVVSDTPIEAIVLKTNDTSVACVDDVNWHNIVPVTSEEPGEAPEAFHLSQAYPNPFNPITTISFELPESSHVRLVVIDVLGRQISVLLDGTYEAGTREVVFDAADLPSGTYLYRLETPQGSLVKTMLLAK